MNAGRLNGLTALVTGASRGIGAGVVRAFATRGASLVLTARDPSLLEAVAEDARARGAEAVRTITADLSDPRQRLRLIQAAGPVDVLVQAAGVLGPVAEPLWQTSQDSFEAVMEVNVTAMFDLIRSIVPGMASRGRGTVVNVSSSVGTAGRRGWGAYSVSKFAVEGMSQTLAEDLEGSGVRCVVINPGGTRTDMRAQAKPDEDPSTLPTPDDVAAVFVAAALGELSNGERVNAREWMSRHEVS